MKKIGLTGNIGSGKTTVSSFFKILDVPVYNSDQRAKWLMSNDFSLKSAISSYFGSEAYSANNQLNTVFISNIVFNDLQKLNYLNGLVHPLVASDFDKWCISHSKADYVIKEAAVLFKSNSYKSLDKVICVVASDNLRLNRVVERDNMSESEIRLRMDKQLSQSDLISRCDFVIDNEETILLSTQILKIHTILVK